MKKLIFATATACLLLASCSGDKQANDGFVVLDIVGNMDADNTDNFDEIADVKMMFHPELTDSTQIGGFSIRGIIDNNLYVYYNQMMIFAPDGKCISSFSRSGGGPGEYRAPWIKWGVPYNGNWMVVDYQAIDGKTCSLIYNYTPAGKYLGTDTIPIVFGRGTLVPYKKEGWMNAEAKLGENFIIEKYDTKWNRTDTIRTPFVLELIESVKKPGKCTVVSPYMPTSPNICTFQYRDTVYEPDFATSKLTPRIALKLGDYLAPKTYCPLDSTGDYIDPKVYLTTRHALVTYNHSDECVVQFYDRTNGKLVASFRTPYDPKDKGGYRGVMMKCAGEEIKLRPLDYTTDDTFFFNADSETMSEITGDIEANPALYSVKLK